MRKLEGNGYVYFKSFNAVNKRISSETTAMFGIKHYE